MKKKIKDSWFIKALICIVLQAIILITVVTIYSENRETADRQEKAAIQRVNNVCNNRGGIDDADEEERSWEVRCENDKTFIINKYGTE